MDNPLADLPQNPKDDANFLSKLLFFWTMKLFLKGRSKPLELEDLYKPLKCDNSAELGDRLERNWCKELKRKNPSLTRAVIITFWKGFLCLFLMSILNDLIIRMSQPIVLGKFLEHFRLGDNEQWDIKNQTLVIYYGAGTIVLSSINLLIFAHFILNSCHLGMRVRIAVCSLIYRKALRMSNSGLGVTSPGKVVNLLSNDVSRFDSAALLMNSVWSAPLMCIMIGFMMWQEINWIAILGVGVVLTSVPLQVYTGKLSGIYRFQTAIRTDERVRFMDEILFGVKVIKMYAWERPFTKLISLARKLELKFVRKGSHVRALYMTFNLFTTRAAMFSCMIAMAITGVPFTAAKIFLISFYFSVLQGAMSQMFVRGLSEVSEVRVSFRRLQEFLEYEERITKELVTDSNGTPPEKEDNEEASTKCFGFLIAMQDITAAWQLPKRDEDDPKLKRFSSENPTLQNISLEIKKGCLIGICGAVGSGKSSLLQVILKEIPILKGHLEVNGSLSYASQEPWIIAADMTQNILFGEKMIKHRYDGVVRSCALLQDFKQFSNGDKTKIGENGALLSGGQKARVSLARAIYREADIYLLDDPLSAVDAHVGKHLFDEVIGQYGRLAGKTRILVTHQIRFLSKADWVIILEDNEIKIQGHPQELSKSGIVFSELLQIPEQNESDEDDIEFMGEEFVSRSLESLPDSIESVDNENNTLDETQNENFETTSRDVVKESLLVNYIKSGSNLCITIIMAFLFFLTHVAVSATDYWVAYWTFQEEQREFYSERKIYEIVDESFHNLTKNIENQNYEEASAEIISLLSTKICMYIHGVLITGIFIIGIIRAESFYAVCKTASQKLHDGMFHGIISTSMRFFDTNPSGWIMNRFSKDLGQVDEILPKTLFDAIQAILSVTGSFILTGFVKPIFLPPALVLGFFFMCTRVQYLKTTRNIKRLEGITRSPAFSHFSETLEGLSTVRAFGVQNQFIKKFDDHQDVHSSVYYLYISAMASFGFYVDYICVFFISGIIMHFVFLETGMTGSEIGLAITQSMGLAGLLQYGIKQSAESSNQLMSVERILQYCQLDDENKSIQFINTSKEWPYDGKIEFKNVFYKYFEGGETVLKGLTFVINPQEKVGIVGRTGAGKSSLIGALFRLAKIEGEILIDDINTRNIALSELRSKVSIIPQDPVLFSGTLRRNLDPFEEYPDSDLWNALETLELREIVSGNLGLQTLVTAKGGNFSVGQRQLICLARAILRKNKILILDEATANVDPHTDSLIQRTIREQFSACTVLTVAHRLHTIMDSDKILVINLGQVAEFDIAFSLLQNNDSIFKNMVDATGYQESQKLFEIARTKFKSVSTYL